MRNMCNPTAPLHFSQIEPRTPVQTGPIGQEYGKYGIIRETDMYSKRPEFQLWAIEVRIMCSVYSTALHTVSKAELHLWAGAWQRGRCRVVANEAACFQRIPRCI